ncbi:MAG: DUF480 domain-containing protein [Methyloglobulus sp.]
MIKIQSPVASRKIAAIGHTNLRRQPSFPNDAMKMNLNLNETRVVGCLIEKAITTPDQYPLSLNALVNACNQKSNRDPVLELKEITVQDTVDGLIKKFLVSRGYGSRVTKYQHRFCNSEFGTLQLSEKATGIICELFLRGPQTPGELRNRTERLCKFEDVNEVEAELESLMTRDEPLVAKLPREPGKRESRYAHLFSGSPQASTFSAMESVAIETEASDRERIDTLEKQVYKLQLGLDELRQKYEHLAKQKFE